MRHTADLLSHYAQYHRDRRNLQSHRVGVPLIVFALGLLLARPGFDVGAVSLTPAWIAFAAAAAWYLGRGNVSLGAAVSSAIALLLLLAQWLVHGGATAGFGLGLALFVLGWAIQGAGHWYEGRRPACADDLVGLLVGPMFLTAEALFALGWNKPLRAEIERRAGPTVLRDLARIA